MAATKKKTTAKTEPTKYQVGESVTYLGRGMTSNGPSQILTVAKCGKRDMVLSNNNTYRVNDPMYRATEPTDAESIRIYRLRGAMNRLDSDALDAEALESMGPHFRAWEGRVKRRRLRISAMLRVALIDGPKSLGDLSSIVSRGLARYSEGASYISGTGATETSDSRQHNRKYERTSTREDHIDAVVLRMASESPTGVYFNQVLAAVDGELGWLDGVELRKEVIDSADRCGRVNCKPSDWIILQSFETNEGSDES